MTTTALSRWSCSDKTLPDVASVKQVEIYDFDNTLFRTPLPSRAVWEGPSIGLLQGYDVFTGGGWWHDSQILASIGGGVDKMEPTAWEGWWEEKVVAAARESIANPAHLTVLMTGRSQSSFSDLIKRILRSKDLEFDLVVLKPEITPAGNPVPSTAAYKNIFFRDAMTTYVNATKLLIYEDRAKQAKEFSKSLEEWNDSLKSGSADSSRPAFDWDIELIEPSSVALDPEDEIAQITRMINSNNAAVALGKAPSGTKTWKFETSRKYTGYLIAPKFTSKLKTLLVPGPSVETEEIRPLADNIMLSFNPPMGDMVARAGGFGAKQEWRTVSVGCNKDRIWAVRVEPVDPSRPHPNVRRPMVVLGHLPRVKTNEANEIKTWTPIPPEKQIVFTTEVGDKALVRIVQDNGSSTTHPRDHDGSQLEARKRPRHSHAGAGDQSSGDERDEYPPLPRSNNYAGNNVSYNQRGRGRGASAYASVRQGRDRNGQPYSTQGSRGYANAARGGRGGGGKRGGRGGQYRSLDDAGTSGYAEAEGMQY